MDAAEKRSSPRVPSVQLCRRAVNGFRPALNPLREKLDAGNRQAPGRMDRFFRLLSGREIALRLRLPAGCHSRERRTLAAAFPQARAEDGFREAAELRQEPCFRARGDEEGRPECSRFQQMASPNDSRTYAPFGSGPRRLRRNFRSAFALRVTVRVAARRPQKEEGIGSSRDLINGERE